MKLLRVLGAFLAVALLTMGCGGGSHPAASRTHGRGKAKLRILWPARSVSRLIPAASNLITVTLTQGTMTVGTQSVSRPTGSGAATSVVELDNLPYATLGVEAQAFPDATGTSVAQAMGSGTVTIVGDSIATVTVSLASTVASLSISPSPIDIAIGKTATLTASAKDASGNIVLLVAGGGQETLTWLPDAAGVASVVGNGPTATITGVADGVAHVTATFVTTDGGATVKGTATTYVGVTNPTPCGDPLSVQTVGCTLGAATHAEQNVQGTLTTARVDEMAQMGASYIRMDLRHDDINSSDSLDPSTYNFNQSFSPYDAIINEALAKNLRVILIVGHGYANPPGSGGNYVVPIQDPMKTVYDTFLKAAVAHYLVASQNHQIIWEIWNEPTSADASLFGSTMVGRADTFMTLFNDAVGQIRSVDPEAIVAAPTLALYNDSDGGTAAFMSECINNQGLLSTPNLLLDVHPGEKASVDSAGANIDLDPETRWGRDPANADTDPGRLTLNTLRTMAPTTPILISEWSFNCSSRADNQAAQMVRSFLCGMDEGATSICVYQYMEEYMEENMNGTISVNDPYEVDHGLINRSGGINGSGGQTQNWTAFQSFVNQLGGYTPQGRIQIMSGGHRYQYTFKNAAGSTKVVTWAQGSAYVTGVYQLMPVVSGG